MHECTNGVGISSWEAPVPRTMLHRRSGFEMRRRAIGSVPAQMAEGLEARR